MSVISGLKNLKDFLQNHHLSFSSGILILLTVGGEQIFQATVFNCPCTQPLAAVYGLIFLIIPAMLLAMIGIAVSNLTWRVLHGCCYGSIKTEEAQKPDGRVENVPQMVSSNGFKKACVNLFTVCARSFLVPVTWLSLAFLDGSYYACIRSKEPCAKDSPEYKAWKEESQIISWCLLLVVAVISFIVIGITRCMDSVKYAQYKYISDYREVEERQFDSYIKTHSETEVKDKIRRFMESPRREDWNAITLAPGLSGSSLSPLDEWFKKQPPEAPVDASQAITAQSS